MKISIPVSESRYLASELSDHFGKAPFHMVLEGETGEVESVIGRAERGEGECAPVGAMLRRGVEAVVCHGLGRGAYGKLVSAGLRVFRTEETTVEGVLRVLEQGDLEELKLEEACAGHGHEHGGCGHGHD